jgi:TetR/AcrR family transcriptional regulator, regulator of cefoperazone and chloramphenicol sensitivity
VHPAPNDLTARARIRDAALVLFAQRGVKATTIKDVAESANVSPGLVQHHFGTKDNLRKACDDAVIEQFRRQTTQAAASGELTNPAFIDGIYAASPPLIRYLARSAVDGGPAATAVLDELAAGAEEFLSRTWPARFPVGSPQARDAAAVMCAMHTGVIVLHDHLVRQMGTDLDSTDAARIALAMTEVYAAMGDFTASTTGEQLRQAVIRYRDQPGGNQEDIS